jgi:hypothetical protein
VSLFQEAIFLFSLLIPPGEEMSRRGRMVEFNSIRSLVGCLTSVIHPRKLAAQGVLPEVGRLRAYGRSKTKVVFSSKPNDLNEGHVATGVLALQWLRLYHTPDHFPVASATACQWKPLRLVQFCRRNTQMRSCGFCDTKVSGVGNWPCVQVGPALNGICSLRIRPAGAPYCSYTNSTNDLIRHLGSTLTPGSFVELALCGDYRLLIPLVCQRGFDGILLLGCFDRFLI